MKTAVIVVSLVVLLVVGSIASLKGLDLRKWSSWLYSAISFLCGLVPVFLLTGNWSESLKGGAIFSFVTLFTGAMTRRHKQRYNEDYARSLLLKYGKEDDLSFFAKLVRQLLNRYK